LGHVGLSIGNGEVIHAWDKVRINNYLDLEKVITAPGWENQSLLDGYHVNVLWLVFKGKYKKNVKYCT